LDPDDCFTSKKINPWKKMKIHTECGMTCGKCGEESDLFEACKNGLGFDLPKDTYRCPHCKHTFKLVITKPAEMTEYGFVMPPEKEIQTVESPEL